MEIMKYPDASVKATFVWVFIVGALSVLFAELLSAILALMGFETEMFGFVQLACIGGTGGINIVAIICAMPLVGLGSVFSFAIGVAITQWVAKRLRGAGTYDKLAYAFRPSVPVLLISIFLVLFKVETLGLLFGLYALYLDIAAVKVISNFGWGRAFVSVLSPTVALVVIFVCTLPFISIWFGPMIEDTFNQINQSLPP